MTITDPQRVAPAQSQPVGAPILEVHHLRQLFPAGGGLRRQFVHAVEDASLALYPGRALALVGESGSGKTTIARMLARLYTPTSGKIRFKGAPVEVRTGNPILNLFRKREGIPLSDYRRHVQLIFQDPFASLNPVHDVRYHLARLLHVHGHARTATQATEQTLALLGRVNLTPPEQFLNKYPHQLSGGQRQRIAIARALAVQPQVVLADEPVSMLDVSIRLDILNLLRRLKDEDDLAFLFITHDIATARYFAEETAVLYAGQMVEGGPSNKVIQQPKHPYTQLLISAAPDPARLDANGKRTDVMPARGEIPSLVNPPTGCRFHPRCPHAMPVCRERFPGRTNLGNGHWTNCFLYGDGEGGSATTT
jgi:peptide/nickel transport system ATP-binding protein